MCIKAKIAWFDKRKRKLKKDGKDYGDFVETRQIKAETVTGGKNLLS